MERFEHVAFKYWLNALPAALVRVKLAGYVVSATVGEHRQ
jgi:hypothetical protein